MIPGKEKGQSLTVGAGRLSMVYLSYYQTSKRSQCLCGIHDPSGSHAKKYYDVDGSPNSDRRGQTSRRGFTACWDDQICLYGSSLSLVLQQYWTSEADFHTLTMNYVLTGDKQGMVNDLNAFFNPMKADVD